MIKLRMEIGNVSKRQQPNQRAENSVMSETGQHSEKIQQQKGISYPLYKMCTNVS